eukprot:11083535-Lingulodinium_polyedra.AAC.1
MPAPTPPLDSMLARSRGLAEIQQRAACRPASSKARRPKSLGLPPPTCPFGSISVSGAASRCAGRRASPMASSGSAAKRARSSGLVSSAHGVAA